MLIMNVSKANQKASLVLKQNDKVSENRFYGHKNFFAKVICRMQLPPDNLTTILIEF